MRPAPQTFDTKLDAQGWLTGQVQDVALGTWSPDVASRTGLTVKAYATRWLRTRTLRPSTRANYQRLLDGHILPALGAVPLTRLSPATVREWHAQLLPSAPAQRAHVYALLRAIMATAVEDDIVPANPCRIRGAGTTKRARKVTVATLEQIATIIDNMPDHYEAMVLLAVWCGPRSGELRELRRKDIAPDGSVIHIRRGVVMVNGEQIVGPTKSEAGIRDVDVPPHVVPRLLAHLDTFVGQEPDALLFPAAGDHSQHMRSSTLANAYGPARIAAGRPDLRWHDLRHTGATLSVAAGASLKEVMERLGHSTVQASLLYQHAAEGRGKEIAARLSEIAIGDGV